MDPFTAIFLIVAVVLMAVSYLLTKSPKKPKQDQKFDLPVVQEGKIIGLLYGTELIKDLNVVNYWDLKIVAEAKPGGKKQ